MSNTKPELLRKSREWYYANLERTRDKYLRRLFGITLREYNLQLTCQGGKCALCGGGPDAKGKALAVDHDHLTGKIRGLLCRGCNVGIGNLKEDPGLLEKAASYVRDGGFSGIEN